VRSLIVAAFVCASVFGSIWLWPATEYLPSGNRNLVIAILLPPPGYNIDKMIELGEGIERRLAPSWADEPKPGVPRIRDFFFVARGRMLFLGAKAVDDLRAGELIPILAAAAGSEPGVIPIVSQSSLFDSGLTGGRTIDVEITGPDLEGLVEEAQKAFGLCMQEFPPIRLDPKTGKELPPNQLRPIPGLDLNSPELHVVPKLEQAAELGVTSASLGYAVNALVDGAFAGDYWHEGRRIDLVICGDDDYASHSHDLENLPIRTASGQTVRLSAVAEVVLSRGPEQINHIERQRSITIQLTPAEGIALEAAMKTIDEKVRKVLMQSPNFRVASTRFDWPEQPTNWLTPGSNSNGTSRWRYC
jgi:HAE1 family hydrophobic/amphiphilic exporter-1